MTIRRNVIPLWRMFRQKHAPHLMRGHRFADKNMRKRKVGR
jgi:hypothetical protein